MALSFSVLRNRDFRLLLITRLFVTVAWQAQAVIIGWQVYTLTHSTLMLGLVGLAEAIPALACALFAGHVVDVGRPVRIYVICLFGLALNMLMLFLAGGEVIPLAERQILYVLFLGEFISGIGRSFLMPASFTLLSRFVPRPDIPAASAWMSSGFQISAIVAPALAGLIFGGYGARVAWMIPMLFMVTAVAAIASTGREHRQYRNAAAREPAVQSIKAGWRFILGNRVLLSIMALDMLAVLFGGVVAILPAFADKVLHTGSEELGLLRAAPAVGSIATALYFAVRPMKLIRATTLLWVVAGFGVAIVGLGLIGQILDKNLLADFNLKQALFLSLLCLAISGAFDSVSMVIRSTLMQLLTPDAMRGRVSSVNSMFIVSSNELGAFESGVMASLLGLVPSILVGGAATLAIVGFTAWLAPELRRTVVDTEADAPA